MVLVLPSGLPLGLPFGLIALRLVCLSDNQLITRGVPRRSTYLVSVFIEGLLKFERLFSFRLTPSVYSE